MAKDITFSLWDRIKFLFGIRFKVKVNLYTMNDQVNIVESEIWIDVPDLFPRKNELGGVEIPNEKNNQKL